MSVGQAPVSMILAAWIGLLLILSLSGVAFLILLAQLVGCGPFAT